MPSRATPYQTALTALFATSEKSFSLAEIRQEMERKGYTPHRSTLFRELRTLLAENLIEEVGRGKTRAYKGHPRSGTHHHHAVCDTCNTVLTIELPQVEAALTQAERALAAESSFLTLGHHLSVTGRCASCQGASK